MSLIGRPPRGCETVRDARRRRRLNENENKVGADLNIWVIGTAIVLIFREKKLNAVTNDGKVFSRFCVLSRGNQRRASSCYLSEILPINLIEWV